MTKKEWWETLVAPFYMKDRLLTTLLNWCRAFLLLRTCCRIAIQFIGAWSDVKCLTMCQKHSSFFVKEQFRRMRQIWLKKGKVIFLYSKETLFCLWSHLEMVIFFKCTNFIDNKSRGIGLSTEVTLYVTSGWNKTLHSSLTVAVYSHVWLHSMDYF